MKLDSVSKTSRLNKMKRSCIIYGLNILFPFIFQVVSLHLKFFSTNKRKLVDLKQSRIQLFSNHSVMSRNDELTEKYHSQNIPGAHHFGNVNYTNDSGTKD